MLVCYSYCSLNWNCVGLRGGGAGGQQQINVPVFPKLNSFSQYIVYAMYEKCHKAKMLSKIINSKPFQMRKRDWKAGL